ncbi:LysR family transcriptional regulator [Comamonas testosteroni]|uniref:LysR family transcriptional regulator n=1 Tax=Comamonas testosteroni TaxID=285 RepID=UPI0015FAEE4B|nr:LysR family transcriptional regulator [Comamonas testosteroni]
MQFGDDNRRMPAFQDSRARYLFEAVYCGSVRAAAEKLGIVPSAVSRQISLLEEELGLTLLERHRSGVVPTEAGQLLLDYHREHTAHRHDMLAKVDALRGLHSGSVSVVSGEGFAQELIDGPIRNFRQQYPGVSISLEIYGTTEIMRRIREDAAEIGLVYYPPADSHITARGAARQPMHAIVHAQHPLASAEQTSLRELSQWPVAMLQGVYGIRQLVEYAEHKDKIHLSPALTSNLISVLLAFVTSGQGVTLLPPCSVTAELASGRLRAIPIHNPAFLDAEMQLITRTGRHLSPAANRFLLYCMQGMQAFQEP